MATFDIETTGTPSGDWTDTSIGRFVTNDIDAAASLAKETHFMTAFDTNGIAYQWTSVVRTFADAPTPAGGASYVTATLTVLASVYD